MPQPSGPGEGACSPAAGCGERVAGLPPGSGACLPVAPLGPHPLSICIGTCGGRGREDREGGLPGGPSLCSPLPARPPGSPFSSPAPGRVPGCSPSPAPSAKWLKGEGSPRVEEEGCVWRGGPLVPGGVAGGRDVDLGGARTRAPARQENGWSREGLGGAGRLDGRRSRAGR